MHSKKTVLIVDLMNAANMELIRLDFRSSALSRHDKEFRRFCNYCTENGIQAYDAETGPRYFRSRFGLNIGDANIKLCAYRLYAVERKIDTKVRNIGQQKCYNDLRKRRRSLAWHEQRASRLKNFALVSARKRAAGRNYSGFGFQTALSARNAAVRNITQFAGGTRSSAVPADTRLPSPQKPLCTARICL